MHEFQTNFANAGKACHCALNLKPLSVETKEEMDCLAKVAQGNNNSEVFAF
jgi:hypothetical protein